MSSPSAQSFIKLLEMSGIVESESLQPELEKIRQSMKESGASINGLALAEHLVESGLITRWHTEKLLSGKYKGFLLGKFKLLGHLGTGGMSRVYLARHRISNQLRAIKVLPRTKVDDKSYLDRFYLEARAAASLNHPNVVRIYDICNEGNTHYMVMEYVKGRDLSEVVKDEGPLPWERAVNYTLEAAIGLRHAHLRGLVHRDIKPANLLLTDQEDLKILDLGLALVNQDESESLTVMYNEKVMGTADYLSPEQAVNSHQVDHRADIYSLGCTLYFLLAGHPPFPDGTLAQRIAKHQTEDPRPLGGLCPNCPETLVRICQRMMKKRADDRYQSCDELITALQSLLDPASRAGKRRAAIRQSGLPVQPSGSLQIDTASQSGPHSRLAAGTGASLTTPTSIRRKKKPPKWVLPVAISVMFLILIGVLALLATYIK